MNDKSFSIVLIVLLLLTISAIVFDRFMEQKKEVIETVTLDYYNENICVQTQQCENRCNQLKPGETMFCDYACMEKKYCDPERK